MARRSPGTLPTTAGRSSRPRDRPVSRNRVCTCSKSAFSAVQAVMRSRSTRRPTPIDADWFGPKPRARLGEVTSEATPPDTKLEALRALLRELGSVLVCYSGGIDSAFVLAVAHQ